MEIDLRLHGGEGFEFSDFSMAAGLWQRVATDPSVIALVPRVADLICMGFRSHRMTMQGKVIMNEDQQREWQAQHPDEESIECVALAVMPRYFEDAKYFDDVFRLRQFAGMTSQILRCVVPGVTLLGIPGPFMGQLFSRENPWLLTMPEYAGPAKIMRHIQQDEGRQHLVAIDTRVEGENHGYKNLGIVRAQN